MIIYTVEQGDTLGGIARQFGTTPLRIAADNGLRTGAQLAVGQSLLINSDSIRYVVEEGQTLYSIAQQFGIPLEELLAANPDVNPLNLQRGSIVTVPVGEQPERIPAYVNGYAYPTITPSALNCVLPFLTFLSPFSYSLTPEGDLIPPADDDLIYRSVRSAVMPLMVVTNLYNGGFSTEAIGAVLADEAIREKVIDSIVRELQNKAYYGVSMDIEYIAPSDRESYNSFLQQIADRVRGLGYILVVALAPKISADQQGLLYEAHDYAAQGAIADYVILMTYEYAPQ